MSKKILKLLVFCFTLVFVLSFLSIAYAQDTTAQDTTYELTSQDKVLLTQPSVCFITTYYWGYVLDPWDNIWSDAYYWAFAGTGFCVNPETGHIITAGHMVEISEADFKYDLIYTYLMNTYGSDLDVWTDDNWNWAYENIKVEGYEGGPYDREVYVQFNNANAGIPDNPSDIDTFIRAEVIDYSGWEQRDIALLRIQPQTGKALSSVMIGDSSMVEIQDNLTIIGYPWTSDIGQENVLSPTITSGSISGRLMLSGTEVLQIQGDARPGNSGGPVLNKDGQVVGILTMLTDETNNYLRPSNDIKEMLNRNGVTNKLGMVDEEFKQGLVMYRLKHYSEAIEHFNAMLNLNQKHLLAQEYRSKSQEAINRGEDVQLVEEPPIEEEEIQEVPEKEIVETEESEAGLAALSWLAALSLKMIILVIVLPILFVIIIVVVVVVLVKRRSAPTKTETMIEKPVTKEGKPKKEESKEKVKYCPSCGNKVEEGKKFCSSCGGKLS